MKLAYIVELLSTKPLLREQNNVKRLQRAKVHKDWAVEQWNTVLSTNESNRRVIVRRRVGERAPTSCYRVGAFANCKVRNLHQVKGKLNQSGYHSILLHHAIPSGTRLVAQRFVLIKDNDPMHICM